MDMASFWYLNLDNWQEIITVNQELAFPVVPAVRQCGASCEAEVRLYRSHKSKERFGVTHNPSHPCRRRTPESTADNGPEVSTSSHLHLSPSLQLVRPEHGSRSLRVEDSEEHQIPARVQPEGRDQEGQPRGAQTVRIARHHLPSY